MSSLYTVEFEDDVAEEEELAVSEDVFVALVIELESENAEDEEEEGAVDAGGEDVWEPDSDEDDLELDELGDVDVDVGATNTIFRAANWSSLAVDSWCCSCWCCWILNVVNDSVTAALHGIANDMKKTALAADRHRLD